MANPQTSPGMTDFANMGLEKRLAWARSVWQVARVNSFAMRFMGNSANSVIQRITELTKVNGASQAVIQLVADLQGDGVGGDDELEQNEEQLRAFEQKINFDQLRHAVRNKGRVSDKKSTISFRNFAKDKLGQFFGDRIDQLAFQTLAGVAYSKRPNGAARTSNTFANLAYAADVKAPTANRHLRVVAGGTYAAGDTTAVAATDLLNYKSLVRAKAFFGDTGLRGIKVGGEEMYHVFTTKGGMADLRLDADFLANVRSAGVRGDSNPLFAGATSVLVDGMVIHEHKYVPNTSGAAAGSKWGAAGDVNGVMNLVLGAQAMGFVDFGAPGWVEKSFDYSNNHGVASNKIFGMLKPQFHNDWTGAVEDYGVGRLDSAVSM